MTTVHSFRGDLQGLRAIAVTAVVLCHAGIAGFSGGFVGVDLFFVLSGFLITGVLQREYSASGSIGFAKFLSHRIKRLLPAMLLMIGASMTAAFFLLPDFEAKTRASSAPFASLWVSNLYFTFTSFDYFNELAVKDLFLHTWSLGVEEQFYLLWPILLAALFRITTVSESVGAGVGFWTLAGLAVIGFASFFLNVYWLSEYPLAAFYLMPARVWQFTIGALLYLVTLQVALQTVSIRASRYSGAMLLAGGIVAVGCSVWFYDSGMPYPGVASLLPSLGAALIIIAGQKLPQSQNPLGCLPLVWLGNRSYSLYLWHWPVLLLANTVFDSLNFYAISAVICISLVLADVTYRWVEMPFWKGALGQFGPGAILQTGLLLISLALLISFHAVRMTADAQFGSANNTHQFRSDLPKIYSMNCDSWYFHDEVEPCYFGAKNPKSTALLLGDSIGVQWFSLVESAFGYTDWRIVVLTKSACPMVDESFFYPRIKKVYKVCEEWRDKVLNRLREWEPDVIITGSASSYEFSDKQWVLGSQRVWERLTATGAKVLVLPGTPSLGVHGPACLKRKLYNEKSNKEKACSSDRSDTRAYEVAKLLKEAASNVDNVDVVDLNPWVCKSGLCSALDENGTLVFRDTQHLTDGFVKSLIPELAPLLVEAASGGGRDS